MNEMGSLGCRSIQWRRRWSYLFGVAAVLTYFSIEVESFGSRIAPCRLTSPLCNIHYPNRCCGKRPIKFSWRLDDSTIVDSESEELTKSTIADTIQQDDIDGDDESFSRLFPSTNSSSFSSEVVTDARVDDDDETEYTVQPPSLRRILSFAIPAIGVWLCNPLLSMIDTSTVGMLSGTIQQGALNPAVTVTDYSARIMSFLYVATTNSVATSQEADRRVNGMPQTTKTLVGALQLSVWAGIALGGLLFIMAKFMLRHLIGNDTLDPAVLAAAEKYVRIRALGMPAAAVIGSAQAACLGLQDIKSPLYVIVIASVINFFSDLLLVGSSNPWVGGAAGAAWATIFSQYVAVSLFLKWLFDKSRKTDDNIHGGPHSQSFVTERQKTLNPLPLPRLKRPNISTRGFLADRCTFRDILRVPSSDTIDGFAHYFVPVTTTMIGRTSAYIAMNHVVSSCFGTLSMAANQIMTSLFYALVPISDSLSLTAQSFVPGICEIQHPARRAKALQVTTFNFLKAAALFGITLSGIVACIPVTCGKLFSSDPAVIALVNSLVPIQIIYFALHGVFCASEGILLGQKDLTFLGRMYAIYFAIVPWLMLRVKRAAMGGTANLTTVWRVLLAYQLVRILAWTGRVIWLQTRANNKARRHQKDFSNEVSFLAS